MSEKKDQKKLSVKASEYRFKRLELKIVMQDIRFKRTTPRFGDVFPAFNLITTTGKRINRQDFIGKQPLMLVFGSITCPMTVSSFAPLKRLHGKYGDKVTFVTLNVREAHPAENYHQPETLEEKIRHAKAMKDHYALPWTVAVDDIEGGLHQALDTKPNAVFIMNTAGKIVFRSLWAGDEQGLEQALEHISVSKNPVKKQSTVMFSPLARGIGYIHEVLKRAGPKAQRDMFRVAFPMFLAGWVASLFRPLSFNSRGSAALVTLGSLTVVAISVVLWLS